MTLTNLRLVKERHGRLSCGEYEPPIWAVCFERNGCNCRVQVRIIRPDGNRPTGQEVIDAMRDHIRSRETTEEAILDIKVIE